jgi:hypothetical protein
VWRARQPFGLIDAAGVAAHSGDERAQPVERRAVADRGCQALARGPARSRGAGGDEHLGAQDEA